ncbi:MAG: hypothetical protein LBL19_03510 [Spirochaetaceae bacterium]|jgi:hypothetical protein|nr:hypothetical protein [Spirochaetaceae bacterium]
MAKKKAIYAPGELDLVRKKLGDLDGQEAQRMARLLGGEVGIERSEEPKPVSNRKARPIQRKPVVPDRRAQEGRPAPLAEGEGAKSAPKQNQADSFVPAARIPYRERVKMDKYASDPVFEIKSFFQVFYSIIAIFGEIPDRVNPLFVTQRINDYYKKIEALVTTTRTLLPRNNLRRNEQLKRTSVFTFAVLDVIRRWNLEQITSDLAKIQSHPRKVLVVEFADILRAIYKPLFLLEQLEMEVHIKEAYKLLYKILYLEDPMEAKEKYQKLIRISLGSLTSLRREIRFRMYPLLLKLLSERFLPYEQFFIEQKNAFMAFIGAREEDRISPALAEPENESRPEKTDEEAEEGEGEEAEEEAKSEDAEEKKGKSPAESEKKAVDRGLQVLEKLFPQAGWEKISSFPDFYPYFSDIFHLKKNYELIAPTDPLQQVAILMQVLEELFFGLRFIKFRAAFDSGVYSETSGDTLETILNKWNRDVELSMEGEYLPRLAEYCRILDSSVESRNSNYAKRLLNELHWIKRLYFLPYYKFESFSPPPFKKNEIDALYPEIRKLRKQLTVVAAGIEQGNRLGGAEKKAPCDGITNPWDPYIFQVSNPLSVRLDALLKNPRQRNNASLVFFSLAVVTVLDHIVNDETSWAYADRPGPLFRSVNDEGMRPVYGIEHKVNTAAIFDESIKKEG